MLLTPMGNLLAFCILMISDVFCTFLYSLSNFLDIISAKALHSG